MSRMSEQADAAYLVRAEEAAELARRHAKEGRPELSLAAMEQSVTFLTRAGVDVAAYARAERRSLTR